MCKELNHNSAKAAIIVAGGRGERMGGSCPKQFMLLGGEPLLCRTLRCFAAYDAGMQLVLVLPQAWVAHWQNLCERYRFGLPHRVVTGGETRYHSVKNGLAAVCGASLVAVHDGVRPLLSRELLQRCFSEAAMHGTAIPTVPVTDSLRRLTEEGSTAVDRSLYHAVQTPQVFSADLLKQAYTLPYSPLFTDDASVVESCTGGSVHLVQGEYANIKITTPSDFKVAETLIGDV